jgi:hypothetical protein
MSNPDLPIPTDILDVDTGDNADWLRGMSWNLPTRVDEFLDCLGINDQQALKTRRRIVAQFMRLPAAEAMPGGLRNALEHRSLL